MGAQFSLANMIFVHVRCCEGLRKSPSHSIISSSLASSDGGMAKPSALAVLRLMRPSLPALKAIILPVRFLRRHSHPNHPTSRIISTSTEAFAGRAAIPTADRACLPIGSPNTSTIRSENPFTTLGWLPNHRLSSPYPEL
jgi:hypothetical protein